MNQKYVDIFRGDFTGLQLPFYPRGTGVNYFTCGDCEESVPRPFCEICWVAEGACRFGCDESSAWVGKGESFYWLPGERHAKQAIASGKTVIYYATFDGPGAADILLGFGYRRGALHSGKCPVSLFESLARGLTSPREESYRKLLPLYLELMTRMSETEDTNSASFDKFTEECLYLIQSQCGDSTFNINSLADRLGVHRSTVCRAVRRATGESPGAYLDRCRIKLGLELLRTTFLPVKVIAERTGFGQANYFCRCIRATTGMTPLEWRNRERLSPGS